MKIDGFDRRTGGSPAIPHNPPLANHPYHRGPLRCPSDCVCHCHALSVTPVIPQRLASYIGQIYISNQLLDLITYRPMRRCSIATCRGDFLKPARVSWFLPPWFLHGQLQSWSNRRVHFSINAARAVPYTSPILRAIHGTDVQRVKDLFAKQEASIWDTTSFGTSVLLVSKHTAWESGYYG